MNSTLFTDAMALTPAGDGVYDGELNEHWTIGPRVHGGAMLALCANAARMDVQGLGHLPRAAQTTRGEPGDGVDRSRCQELPVGAPDGPAGWSLPCAWASGPA
jgi:hypothetical protein